MIVIQFSQFSASYKGSFMRSLERLEKLGQEEYSFFYCFPISAKDSPWMDNFRKEHSVFFTNEKVEKSSYEILNIFRKVKPDLVHTHFDGYDLPVSKAREMFFRETGKYVKVIWHLRNQINYEKNYLKKFYQLIIFWNHYDRWGNSANVISVNEGMRNFIQNFSKREILTVKTEVIKNGIDTHYFIKKQDLQKNKEFVFGAFGSFNDQKRIDILLKAGEILINKDLNFKVLLLKGIDTLEVVNKVFNNTVPFWVEVMERTNDIENFYNRLSCFVSTSVHETFSNAIAEATMFEIPVIQSDIPGTNWNAENPSTFLFESLNVEKLAAVMEKVLHYPKDKLNEKCEDTRQINIKKFGVDLWCEKIFKFYDNAQ